MARSLSFLRSLEVRMTSYDKFDCIARSDFCRFLAACYYQPDPMFAEEQVFDSMQAAADRIDPSLSALSRRLGEAFATESQETLLLDYTRLFIGPTGAAALPYGSIWIDGRDTVMGDSTAAVLEFYEAGGFEISEDFRELPDHIAAELEFLYLLLYREYEMGSKDDAEALAAVSGLRKRFLSEQLSRWIKPFTAAIAAGAQSAFYSELSTVTDRFIGMEADRTGTGKACVP
jgi:TorA maturation chaperone TorD